MLTENGLEQHETPPNVCIQNQAAQSGVSDEATFDEFRPNIYFICMHKAASTFIADVLFKDIVNRTGLYQPYLVGSFLIQFINQQKASGLNPARTPQERQEQLSMLFKHKPLPTSNGLIGRLYPGHLPALLQFLNAPLPGHTNRVCVMRRDPRDALVSLYYSISYSHSPEDIEGDSSGFLANRAELKAQTVRDGLKTLLSKRGLDSTMPEFMRCTDLILSNNNACDLPYELLVSDPCLWLVKFAEFAELTELFNEAWMEEIAENMKPPTHEDPNSHKRRIKPGNWMDVFDDELQSMVIAKLGDRLEQFGYLW